jgi:hypothetical protein
MAHVPRRAPKRRDPRGPLGHHLGYGNWAGDRRRQGLTARLEGREVRQVDPDQHVWSAQAQITHCAKRHDIGVADAVATKSGAQTSPLKFAQSGAVNVHTPLRPSFCGMFGVLESCQTDRRESWRDAL